MVKVTLLERKPGVWRVRTEFPATPENKRPQVTETFRGDRRAAERRKAEILAEHAAAPGVQPTRASLAEHVEGWIAQRLALGQITAGSAESYRLVLRTHLRAHAIGARRISDLTPSDVQRFVVEKTKTHAPRTVNQMLGVIHGSLESALRQRLVKLNVAALVEPPRQEKATPRALSTDQIKALLAAADRDPQRDLIRLALRTGLRRGELAALRWADIDLEAGRLFVRAGVERVGGEQRLKGPKSAAGVRDMPIAADVAEMLRAMRLAAGKVALAGGIRLEEMHIFLGRFGGMMNVSAISQAFARVAAAAGLEDAHLHDARHTWVTHNLRAGVPLALVSKRAGHGSAAVTLGIYNHAIEDDADRLTDPFAAIGSG
jgi:integrase